MEGLSVFGVSGLFLFIVSWGSVVVVVVVGRSRSVFGVVNCSNCFSSSVVVVVGGGGGELYSSSSSRGRDFTTLDWKLVRIIIRT